MPYGIRKSPNKNLYWVYNKETGKKFSKKPIPRERAEAQRRAIYASENGYKLNRSRRYSRSRSLRGGNIRSLNSLREKLRKNEVERQQQNNQAKLQAEQDLETLYKKLDEGLLPGIRFSRLSEDTKNMYKVTYVEEKLARSWLYDRHGTALKGYEEYLMNGSTFNDPLHNYFPFYFKKSLEMPDSIQLPDSVKKTLEIGLKLDNFGWLVVRNIF